MTAPTKLQRQLDVIAYLVGRRLPVSVEELMEGIPAYAEKWTTDDATARDSVRRMFERDKDDLRAAGIPLKTIKYTIDHGTAEAEGYIIEGQGSPALLNTQEDVGPIVEFVRGLVKRRASRAA